MAGTASVCGDASEISILQASSPRPDGCCLRPPASGVLPRVRLKFQYFMPFALGPPASGFLPLTMTKFQYSKPPAPGPPQMSACGDDFEISILQASRPGPDDCCLGPSASGVLPQVPVPTFQISIFGFCLGARVASKILKFHSESSPPCCPGPPCLGLLPQVILKFQHFEPFVSGLLPRASCLGQY